jgi:hypothetical protein
MCCCTCPYPGCRWFKCSEGVASTWHTCSSCCMAVSVVQCVTSGVAEWAVMRSWLLAAVWYVLHVLLVTHLQQAHPGPAQPLLLTPTRSCHGMVMALLTTAVGRP